LGIVGLWAGAGAGRFGYSAEKYGDYGSMAGENTRFKSGNPGKPKGAVSKVTSDVRETIKAALGGVTSEKLGQKLNSLDGKDYIDAVTKLAEYVVPKLARTQLAADDTETGRVSVTLNLGGPPKDGD
jgi:hypothetical protein